jgi:hypothetical protein
MERDKIKEREIGKKRKENKGERKTRRSEKLD